MKDSENKIEIQGEWFTPDKKQSVGGLLIIWPEKSRIILRLTEAFNNEYPYKFKDDLFFTVLHGTGISGHKLTLINLRRIGMHDNIMANKTSTYLVKYALTGVYLEENSLKFNKISVYMNNIIRWSGLCDFHQTNDYEKHNYEWQHKKGIECSIDDNINVSIQAIFPKDYPQIVDSSIKLYQCIECNISFKNNVKIDEAFNYLNCVKYILSLGQNTNIKLSEYKLFHNDKVYEFDKNISSPLHLFLGIGGKELDNYDYEFNELFDFEDLTKNNNNSLIKWFDKYSKMKPVIDLLQTPNNYPFLNARIYFLSLTQAMETYHARFVTNNIREYKLMVNEIIEEIRSSSNEDHAQYIKNILISDREINANYNGKIHFQSRIGYLLYGNGRISTILCNYNAETFAEKVKYTRNYFTHYDERIKDRIFSDKEMPYVNGILMNILNYHLLNEINIDIEAKVNKNISNICQSYLLYEPLT